MGEMSPWVTPAIGAGASIVGDIANLFGQSKANKQSQQFQENMYNRQRQDALADWTMQNEYNSPSSQMARFRDAGLNPNLIYGQTNEGGTVRSSSPGSFKAEPLQLRHTAEIGEQLGKVYSIKLQEAQTDNVKAQNTNIALDGMLKAAETIKTNIETQKLARDVQGQDINLKYADRIAAASADAAAAGVSKTVAETSKIDTEKDIAVQRNQREIIAQAVNIQEAFSRMATQSILRDKSAAEIAEIRSKISLLGKEGVLKDWEIQLSKSGVSKSDPLYQKKIMELFDKAVNTPAAKLLGRGQDFDPDVQEQDNINARKKYFKK